MLAARNQWMNIVRTVELVMKTAHVETAIVDRILGPVREAEARRRPARSVDVDGGFDLGGVDDEADDDWVATALAVGGLRGRWADAERPLLH
jgi:hypothetical protein